MRQYLIGRTVQSVFLVLLVSALTFTLVRLAPGGPAILMNPDLSAEQREEVRRNLGLDEPVLVQYGRWLRNLAKGDFGVSYTYGTAVAGVVLERLPATLLLTGSAFLLAIVLAIPLGVWTCLRSQVGRCPDSLSGLGSNSTRPLQSRFFIRAPTQ